MIISRLFCLLFFSHFFFYSALASEAESNIKFERFSVKDGLAQSNVYSTLIDSQGFLWAGTEDGLSRFDGYTFRTFKTSLKSPHSISNALVLAIAEDQQGNIWLATRGGGLNKFNPRNEKFTHYYVSSTLASDNNITSMIVDSRNNIWVGTSSGGFYFFDSLLGIFKQYHLIDHLGFSVSGSVRAIIEDSKGNLWIGTISSGLYHFNPKTVNFSHYYHDSNNSKGLNSNYIQSITEDKQGYIWVGTFGGGLNKYDPQSDEIYSSYANNMDSLSNKDITFVEEDSSGFLWIGTFGKGLYRYNSNSDSLNHYSYNPSDSSSISDDIPFTLSEDKQRNIWIGTLGGGLNRFNPSSQIFNHNRYNGSETKGLNENDVRAITEDNFGNHWIGTIGGGLNRFESKANTFEYYTYNADDLNSLSHDDILAIKFDSNNNLWVGTRGGGLNKYNYQTNSFSKIIFDGDNSRRDIVRSIFEDSQGNLWLGFSFGEVLFFNPKTLATISYKYSVNDPRSLSENPPFVINEDNQGNIWVGAFGGGLNLFIPESQSFIHYQFDSNDPNSLSDNNVVTIFNDSKGRLWVGTYGGGLNLFNMETKTFTHFKEKDGLANNVVFGILEDNSDNLWISTNMGVSKFTPDTGIFKNFDIGDGLQSNEFNPNSVYKNSNGELYFGGLNGFNRFDPAKIKEDTKPPKVVITDMLLLNRTIPIVENKVDSPDKYQHFTLDIAIHLTKSIVLSHQDNIIAFEFSALHFTNTKKNKFAYQMVGWDKGWVSTHYKNRRATYTNLPSGDYIFRVKASNSDGYWSEEGTSLQITILPPPWRTWWAYIFYGLFVLSLVIAFIRSQRKKVIFERHINAQLEGKVLARTAELESQKHEIEAQKQEVEEKSKEIVATQKQLLQSSKMASIGTMTAGVAHEINNPTNFTHAAVYMMNDEIHQIKSFLKKLAGGNDAEPEVLKSFDDKFTKLIELTKTAFEGTTRIKTIVEDLRTFARIDATKKAHVQVSDLINSTGHLVRTQYDSIIIETQLGYEPLIKCFPSKLNQVFMNIIVNACQAIESKKSSKSKFVGKVIIKTTQQDNRLIISFEDNGCGMTEQTLNRIYEPFYTTKDVGSGTGLGMAISFGIIEEHGGSIDVESIVDKGTKITVELDV